LFLARRPPGTVAGVLSGTGAMTGRRYSPVEATGSGQGEPCPASREAVAGLAQRSRPTAGLDLPEAAVHIRLARDKQDGSGE